jgi:hypothetical protein
MRFVAFSIASFSLASLSSSAALLAAAIGFSDVTAAFFPLPVLAVGGVVVVVVVVVDAFTGVTCVLPIDTAQQRES